MALGNKFSYREIIKQAYQIVLKNRFLWFFGFFAAAIGTVSEFEPLFKNYSDLGSTTSGLASLKDLYQGGLIWVLYENAKLFFTSYPWQAFFFFIMLAVVFLVVVWLAMVSQVALFNASYKLSRNRATNYAEGYTIGNKHFGPVLVLNLITKVVLYGVLVVIGVPLLSWFLVNGNALGGIFFVLVLFFFFVPFSIVISYLLKYAVAFIVLKEQKASEAVRNAWELFKKYWVISVEMALIVLGIGILMGLAMLIAIGLVSVPFVLIGIFALFFGLSTGFSIAVVLGVLSWFAVIAIFGSAFVAFQYATWTLLFVKLTENRAESKLVRWFGKFTQQSS